MKFQLFNYGEFFNTLKEDPEYEDEATIYEKHFGSQQFQTLERQPFYKDFLSHFKIPFKVVPPEDLGDLYDWDMLAQLIMGSFFSEYDLELDETWKRHPEGKPMVRILISVTTDTGTTSRVLDELQSLQILRLFEIYTREQIGISVLQFDEDSDEECLMLGRDDRIIRYKEKLEHLLKEATDIQKRYALVS